jgi:hypothetical protein
MTDSHDPTRQVGLLRQALDSSKRPIAFLLGAGCPMSVRSVDNKPLIPDIRGMTELVVKEIQSSEFAKPFAELRAGLSETKGSEPNIEEYLSHIRILAEVARHSTFGGLNQSTYVKLDRKIGDVIRTLAKVALPNQQTPYHHLASWILGIRRFVPLELFTTNYDLLLEQALEQRRVPYFDGFIGSREAFFDPYAIEAEEDKLPSRWARLWKLHGSINWWARPAIEPSEVLRSQEEAGECLLVHPSHLKYDESRQMPYLAMMDRLKSFLQRPAAVLVTCGYSFGDRHINVLVRQALAGNPDAMMFGLLRSSLAKYVDALALARQIPNFTLFARDSAIVGTREGPWIARHLPENLPAGVKLGEPKSNDDPNRVGEVLLGDFAQLGLLLQQMIGGTNGVPPAPGGPANGEPHA